MRSLNDWATVENFSRYIAGMNGGKDAGVSGQFVSGQLSDAELDVLLNLYDIIDPPPIAGVRCELCEEYVDQNGNCGCDDR